MKTIENGEIVEDAGDNPDLEREFWAFRDELQQDQEAEGFIKVWKLPLDAAGKARSNSMQQSLLFETPIGESSIDDIIHRVRNEYMDPGEFRTTVCLRGYRRGHRGIKFSKIMAIERPREKPQAPNGNPGIADLLQIMTRNAEQQANRTEAFMREMMNMQRTQPIAPAAAPSFNPVEMMGQVAAMMGVFQNMMGGMRPAVPAVAPTDPIEQLTKTLVAMKQVNALIGHDKGGDDDGGAAGILKAAAPLIKPALELMAQNQRAQIQRDRKPRPAPALVPAAAAAPLAPETAAASAAAGDFNPDKPESDTMQLSEMRKHLADLCDYAEQGADPATVADLLMDLLPEDFDSQLSAMVTEPETFQNKLTLILPRTAKYAAWFESLRAELEKDYAEDPDDTGGGDVDDDDPTDPDDDDPTDPDDES